MSLNPMDAEFLKEAHQNIEEICNEGSLVKLFRRTTASDEDAFGELTTEENVLELRAFPVRYGPFRKKTLASVEWATEVDVIAWLSKKAVYDKGLTIHDIREYAYMEVHERRYGLNQASFNRNIRDDYLYIVIGGTKDGAPA